MGLSALGFLVVFGQISDAMAAPNGGAVQQEAASRASSAPGAKVSDEELMPWMDRTKFKECDVDCLYGKANDVLTLDALYEQNRLQTMQAAVNGPQPPPDVKAYVENQVGRGFCLENESGKECFNRYARLQSISLIKTRTAIITNEDSRARLKSRVKYDADSAGGPGKDDDHRVPVVVASPKPNEANLQAQTTYVPTYDQLRKIQESNNAQLAKTVQDDYQKYVDSLATEFGGSGSSAGGNGGSGGGAPIAGGKSAKPFLTDFVKFKLILRDPDDPSAGTLKIVERDEKGEIQYDETKYQKALALWSGKAPGKESEPKANHASAGPDDDPASTDNRGKAAKPVDIKDQLVALHKRMKDHAKKLKLKDDDVRKLTKVEGGFEKAENGDQLEAFASARFSLVGAVDKARNKPPKPKPPVSPARGGSVQRGVAGANDSEGAGVPKGAVSADVGPQRAEQNRPSSPLDDPNPRKRTAKPEETETLEQPKDMVKYLNEPGDKKGGKNDVEIGVHYDVENLNPYVKYIGAPGEASGGEPISP